MLKSGEYGGWLNCVTPFLVRNCWMIPAVCRRGLVWRRKNFWSLNLWPHTVNTLTQTVKTWMKMWHSLVDIQVHICGELHLRCQKTKSASSLPLIFEIKIFWRVVYFVHIIWNFSTLFPGHMQTPALSPVIIIQKVWVAFDCFSKVVSVIKALFFLFGCHCMRHKPCAQSFCFCKHSHEICCTIVFGITICSARSLHVDRRSSFKISTMQAMFSHVLVVAGLPLLCQSQIDSHPSENTLHQRNIIARCTGDSP